MTASNASDYISSQLLEDRRDTKSRQTEFRRLQEKLDSGAVFVEKAAKKRRKKQDPFTKLSEKISQFK